MREVCLESLVNNVRCYRMAPAATEVVAPNNAIDFYNSMAYCDGYKLRHSQHQKKEWEESHRYECSIQMQGYLQRLAVYPASQSGL